jgi:DNA-binding transcriptional ArsR family regulator
MRPITNAHRLARICKLLSVQTRVRIVQLLKDRALCVGALSARLDVTQGAVSQHLRVLRDADLVVPEKRGHFVHYRLNERTLAKWQGLLEPLFEPRPRKEPASDAGRQEAKEPRRCVRRSKGARSRRS